MGEPSSTVVFNRTRNIEEIGCKDDGCTGCGFKHFRPVAREILEMIIGRYRFTAEVVPDSIREEFDHGGS